MMNSVTELHKARELGIGMDILIISTGNLQQVEFWQQRLAAMKDCLLKPGAIVIVVEEDWPGGAGNGLGTFYAYKKAREQLLALSGIDITERLAQSAAVAIYHTAGQGARLYPLTASEYNNKPAVRLPRLIGPVDSPDLITILEAVILQTAIYAPVRRGRLSVFWSDQIFIPSVSPHFVPRGHIEVLMKEIPHPSAEQWQAQQLDRYGLIATGSIPCYFEKVDYSTFLSLAVKALGISMGSFSLSAPLTAAFLELFTDELNSKQGRIDVEPYLWMPATLDIETYVQLMQPRGVSAEQSRLHHQRIRSFQAQFCGVHGEVPFFSASDIGADSCWWDFGTIDSYYNNIMKLTGSGDESSLMRQFFNLSLDNHSSCVMDCEIGSGMAKNSVLVGVKVDKLTVSDSIILKTNAGDLKAAQSLLYNVSEEKPLIVEPHTIRADIMLPQGKQHFEIYTQMGRDGKADWNVRLPRNPVSYHELYQLLQEIK